MGPECEQERTGPAPLEQQMYELCTADRMDGQESCYVRSP